MPADNLNTANPKHWVNVMNNSRVGRYMDGVEKGMVTRHMPRGTGSSALEVLDLGGGTGRWSRWLSEQNGAYRQLLMDIDRSALLDIRGHSPHLRTMQANAEQIPARETAFDAVIAVQLFGLLQDRPKFLAEVYRVLKPDGTLFISWSNRKSLKGLLYRMYSALKGTSALEQHNFYRTSHTENMAMLSAAGFRVIDAIGYSWTMLPRSHNSPLVDMFVGLERGLRLNKWLAGSPNIISVAKKR